jgi:hypothetical protein
VKWRQKGIWPAGSRPYIAGREEAGQHSAVGLVELPLATWCGSSTRSPGGVWALHAFMPSLTNRWDPAPV